jgi:hypothetical protein
LRIRCLGLLDRFGFAVEQHLEETAPQKAGQVAAGVGVRQYHCADAMVREEYHVALISEQATPVAYDRDSILHADHKPHSVSRTATGDPHYVVRRPLE